MQEPLSRRTLLGRAALGASSIVSARAFALSTSAAAARRPIPLPSPRQVRADFTRMVEFGPRLTASESHNSYIAWLEHEFVRAGLELLPCDGYTTERWLAQDVRLDMLEGPAAGPVKIATYYPRSQETP